MQGTRSNATWPGHARARAALLCASLALAPVSARALPPGTDPPQAPDHAAIAQVLENYRIAVSTGDEVLFSTTLLDDRIPFFAVRSPPSPGPVPDARQIRGVAAFRRNVFHGGRRYTQRFDDIRIAQDGGLAQASLRFVTLRDDGSGGAGWKTLTLIDVGGQWKIASEFYTVRALTAAEAATP